MSSISTRHNSPKTVEKRRKLNCKSPLFAGFGVQDKKSLVSNFEGLQFQESLDHIDQEVYLASKENNQMAVSSSILNLPVQALVQSGYQIEGSDDLSNDFEVKYKTEMCRNF